MQPESPVRIERQGDVAFVVIDNPPINAGSIEVRRGLVNAFAELDQAEEIRGVVLIGDGNTFVAGSDLREFSAALANPQMPEVIEQIEAISKPVVAAIHGAALGGGFEIALACDSRVAVETAVVGLPEVTFGMIPGAGGTVRLPRLVPPSVALKMITSCRRVPAPEALRLGILDRIVHDLRRDSARLALELSGKRRLKEAAVVAETGDFDDACQKALSARSNHPGIAEAIEAVRHAASAPADEALASERATFQRLRQTPEAAALRYLFFAERRSGRITPDAEPFTTIGIVGTGTMGTGIAAAFVAAGFNVRVNDTNPTSLREARARIEGHLERRHPNASSMVASRLTQVADLAGLADCGLVVEAVFEDFGVKSDLLELLGRSLPGKTIIATNTSYLDVNALSLASGRPDRFLGLHFFSPAHVMKLLEVVRASDTSEDTLKAGLTIAKKLGKVAVIAGASEGFIGNRIYNAYRSRCETLVENGAMPWEVDVALETFGFAMGPFAVGDLSGLDIAVANRRRLRNEGRISPEPTLLEDVAGLNRLGVKTGGGWYDYPNGRRQRIPSPAVEALIAKRGIVRRSICPEEIQKQTLGAIINEAAEVLLGGIATRPSDIDLVLVHGYGFPRSKGGPLFWALNYAGDVAEATRASLPSALLAEGALLRDYDARPAV